MPDYLIRPDGTRLAYVHRTGRAPTILFLPGYMSDMAGGKATALDRWAVDNGQAMLRLDYAGCGQSDGAFEDGTLPSWRDDVLAVIDAVARGPLLIVGSSMGGWLMLLVALARPERVAGLVGIAAAPDFTDWGYSPEQRDMLAGGGRVEEPSDYGPPQVTSAGFWRSGQASLLLGRIVPIDCPVRLLHGQADIDVPFAISLRLAAALRSTDVHTILIKGGDHRLSRPEDIQALTTVVARLLEVP
ncbi:MAG: alpha/beta hydrolase fold protein [Sphingomonas bacterium]|nr:alpha/beta hydrolase fold protein [Sphingomonas bacterium]